MASPVEVYVNALNKELAHGDATEHTHRPTLKNLLESSVTAVHATNEPKGAERENKPDYIVRKGTTIVGFIEAKDIDVSLKATLKTPQLKRYVDALPNLILTNYLDFIWIVAGEERMRISLGHTSGNHVTLAADAAARWEELVTSFVNEVAPTISTPAQLARSLAGQTRLLRDLALELLTVNDPDLLEQEESFRTLLVPGLKPQEFADMYAQTAAYGLFTARVFEHTTLFGAPVEQLPNSLKDEPFTLEKAAYLIPRANPFLRQFFQHIASPNLNAQLRWLVEQVADSLAHSNIEKVLHRQSRRQGFHDPVFHFYETFLAEYDPKLRESRGVYYTPEPVVDYIVRSVDWLLTNAFAKPQGLADRTALLLDPATGTATFLRRVIDLIHQRIASQGMAGVWPSYVREHLLPRMFGFELMMAPYTVAHLKLELLLQEHGFHFDPGERLHVYLTNTLDQLHQQTAAMLGQWIAKENEGAEKIKLLDPVEVVLGNPPYSGESRNKSKWIKELLKSYKTEPEGGPLKERNSKWLNDDYVKFIRFAHDRVKRTGHGIVAFITNHAWLDNPTFRGMRAQLMADFDDIYVLDLHGNSKKKERTPLSLQSHGEDKNVFDIEQGVSIVFLVKRDATTPAGASVSAASHRKLAGGVVTLKARVHQADLWGSREFKYNWLEQHGIHDTQWQQLTPALPQLLLVPRDESGIAEYVEGWKVTDIFPVNGTGVITKCDQLNISFSESECLEKMKWFVAATEEEARHRFRLPKPGVRDWRFNDAVADVQSTGPQMSRVKPILYRPFDRRWVYYTGRSKGVMGWPVVKLFRHFLVPNVGLITSRLTKGEQFAHVQVTDTITEVICMSPQTSNNGFVFPLWLIPEDLQPDVDPMDQRRPNLSPRFLADLADVLGRSSTGPDHLPDGVTAEDVLAYVYAVLHSPTYRRRFADYLKSDFPRIPLRLLPASTQQEGGAEDFGAVWARLVVLGHRLLALHLLRPDAVGDGPGFPMQGSNLVDQVRYEPPQTGLNTTDRGRVWINQIQFFDGVPVAAWEHMTGGYQACEKWLKARKGRKLDFNDVQRYASVVAALSATVTLMAEVDEAASGLLW